MTDTKAAAIKHIAPSFIVGSYVAARDFYADKLGFKVQLEIPDDEPFFGIVVRDTDDGLRDSRYTTRIGTQSSSGDRTNGQRTGVRLTQKTDGRRPVEIVAA